MNILNKFLADEVVPNDQLNIRWIILKGKNASTNEDAFNLMFQDSGYVVPLMYESVHNVDNFTEICNKIYRTNAYTTYIKYVNSLLDEASSKMLELINSMDYSAISLEAFQDNIDKATATIGYVKGDKHAIDVSKLEVFDLYDPDVVAKACT